MRPGKLVTFEGGEGSGKSTQIALLREALERAAIPHLITREPGGEVAAEQIRQLLVTGERDRWEPLAETLLFAAARVQHVARNIAPALAEGKLVICDRFVDSTRVYQGIGKGISPAYIDALHAMTLGNCMPDQTFILDIDPALGLARAGRRAGDETRFETMGTPFHQQVREGFLEIARQHPVRCHVLDATASPEALHCLIWDRIQPNSALLGRFRK